MQLWTLVRFNGCCGDSVVMGVFENMQAVSHRLSHVSKYADPGDAYRIALSQLATAEHERERWSSKVDKSTTTEDN